jgi:hypothetical protein
VTRANDALLPSATIEGSRLDRTNRLEYAAAGDLSA